MKWRNIWEGQKNESWANAYTYSNKFYINIVSEREQLGGDIVIFRDNDTWFVALISVGPLMSALKFVEDTQ